MLIAATFAAFFLCLSGFANAQNTYSISGTIYGDDDPLSNASLELRDSSQQVVGTTTSSDPGGTYSFSGLEPGTYKLNITPTDRPDLPASLNNELTITSRDLTGRDFYLLSGGAVVLTGTVRWGGPTGPIATDIDGLQVRFFKQREDGSFSDDLWNADFTANAGPSWDPDNNDPGGHYALNIVPGTYRAGADISFPGGFSVNGVRHASFYLSKLGGYYDQSGSWIPPTLDTEFEVVGSDTAPDIFLPQYVVTSGRVVDENGVGIANVSIGVKSCIENPNSPPTVARCDSFTEELYLQSDDSGYFEFGIPAGYDNWSLTLTPPDGSGFTATTFTGVDLSSAPIDWKLPLNPMPVIEGQVKWPDGSIATDIDGLQVRFFKQREDGSFSDDLWNADFTANAGPSWDPDNNDPGGHYALNIVPGTYRAGADISFPGGFSVNGVRHASFYLSKLGGYYDQSGSWIPPTLDTEFEVVGSDTAPDIFLPQYVVTSGRVVDENGVGIANVSIGVKSCIENPNSPPTVARCDSFTEELYLQSDDSGYFEFGIPSGYDNWSLTLTPADGSGFTQKSLENIDLSVASTKVFVMGLLDSTAPVFVSGPTLKRVSDQTVVIAWQSSEPATSVVSGSGLPAIENRDLKVNHEVTLSGLTPGADYSADIAITDRVLNGPTTESLEFTTLLEPDTTPPVITSGPTLKSITDRSVIVSWSTNEPALTVVNWGTDTLSNRAQLDGTARTDHQIALTGLAPLTDYQVQVSATDFENNGPTLSTVESFRTLSEPDTTPPEIISGPFVTNISDTEATISWITDEPAVSGVSLNDGTQHFVYRDENLVTEHEVRVTGLNASTIYYYTVSSTDEVGNGPTLSAEDFFETQSGEDLTPPEIIEGLKIVGITHQSAVLHWGTDEPAYAVVLYGKSLASMTNTAGDIQLTLDHVIQLTDLEPDTTYYLLTISIDSAGNTTSTNASSFTTLSLPEVAGPAFTGPPTLLGTSETSAALQWETDQAAECFVEYGASGNAELLRIDNAGFYTDHQAVLNSLASNQTYDYLVECRSSSGLATTYVAENQSPAARSGGSAISGQVRLEQVARTPAQITDATIVQRSSDRMVLVVETDQPTTVEARYGTSAVGSQQSATSKRYQRDHVLVLTNLSSSTTYSIAIKSRDLSGDLALSNLADEMTSSATDTTPPQIVGSLSVTASGPDQISVSFTGSEYAVSEVSCIDQNNGGSWTAGSEQLRTQHQLLLKGLTEQTSYRCAITQIDTSGNKRTTNSQVVTLSGTAPSGAPSQPVISNVEYGVGFITLSFSVQSSGTAPLESFTASCTNGTETVTKVTTEATITFTGLDSMKTYRCSVSATNTDGLKGVNSKLTSAITPEEPVLPGLPIWLLYEASKAK